MLVIDHVSVPAAEVVVTGEWDLEALFIRLAASIDSVGAQRVVIDTLETLFGAFTDAGTLRAELRRLFLWLKKRGVTALITGERGDGTLTRYGVEEYVSDCVIVSTTWSRTRPRPGDSEFSSTGVPCTARTSIPF